MSFRSKLFRQQTLYNVCIQFDLDFWFKPEVEMLYWEQNVILNWTLDWQGEGSSPLRSIIIWWRNVVHEHFYFILYLYNKPLTRYYSSFYVPYQLNYFGVNNLKRKRAISFSRIGPTQMQNLLFNFIKHSKVLKLFRVLKVLVYGMKTQISWLPKLSQQFGPTKRHRKSQFISL